MLAQHNLFCNRKIKHTMHNKDRIKREMKGLYRIHSNLGWPFYFVLRKCQPQIKHSSNQRNNIFLKRRFGSHMEPCSDQSKNAFWLPHGSLVQIANKAPVWEPKRLFKNIFLLWSVLCFLHCITQPCRTPTSFQLHFTHSYLLTSIRYERNNKYLWAKLTKLPR